MIALLAALLVQAEVPPGRDCRLGMINDCYTEAHYRCLETALSTMETLACIGAERARQDGALNRAYAEALDRLNARQQATLRAAQRAWIGYRDARCASFLDAEWGSLARISAADCLLSMTIERRLDLEGHPPVSPPG